MRLAPLSILAVLLTAMACTPETPTTRRPAVASKAPTGAPAQSLPPVLTHSSAPSQAPASQAPASSAPTSPAPSASASVAPSATPSTSGSSTPKPSPTPKKPVVTALSLTLGAPGAKVVITGRNFLERAADNIVTFNGVPATITKARTTSLEVTVPAAAADGTVRVRNLAGVGDSEFPFDVVTIQNTFPVGTTPLWLTVDNSQQPWVPVFSDNLVKKVSAAGVVLATAGVSGPTAVAVTSLGEAWVASQSGSNLIHLSSNGTVLASVSSGGIAPEHVAIGLLNEVWVRNNDGVVRHVSATGTVLGTHAVAASGRATPLAVDTAGKCWVRSATADHIVSISAAGVVGTPIPAGSSPYAVAVAGDGALWVTNNPADSTLKGSVTRLSAAGAVLGTHPVGKAPVAMAVDAAGAAWVVNQGDDTLMKLAPNGRLIGTLTVADSPHGIAIAPDGTIWVSHSVPGTITKIAP